MSPWDATKNYSNFTSFPNLRTIPHGAFKILNCRLWWTCMSVVKLLWIFIEWFYAYRLFRSFFCYHSNVVDCLFYLYYLNSQKKKKKSILLKSLNNKVRYLKVLIKKLLNFRYLFISLKIRYFHVFLFLRQVSY